MEPTIQVENKNPSNNNQIAGAILIVGIFIAGAILLHGNSAKTPINKDNNGEIPVATAPTIKTINKDEHIFGNPNAKIVIVEFSDTECPYCKGFQDTLHNIVMKNGGNVAWVYRHFPIAGLHPKAFHEAEATECAWEQGGNDMFWKYIDEVFDRTNSNNSLDVAQLPVIAKDVGLDVDSFNTCLASGKYADKINAQIMEAQRAGSKGTPSSFIVFNGKVMGEIPGAQSFEAIQAQIDALK